MMSDVRSSVEIGEGVVRAIFDQTAVGAALIDSRTGAFVRLNRRYGGILGYSVAEMECFTFQEITHQDDLHEEQAKLDRLLSGEVREFSSEKRCLHKDGSLVWVKLTASSTWEPGEAPTYYLEIVEDVTERHQTLKALQESESRLLESQRMARLGNWYWDVRTGDVEWSDEVYRIFRLDPKEFVPQIDSIQALSPWPEDHHRDQELIERAMRSREQGAYEQRFLFPDGSVGYYASTFQGIYDAGGDLVAMRGTVQDITARREATREREELIARLEAQNAELERFTYTVSHDLKSPLITIKGYIGLLMEDLHEMAAESVKGDLARISNAADKMGELLDDLLELSRIGRLASPSEDVALGELATEAISLLHGTLERKRVRVQVQPNLPAVYGERVRLLEVMQNLIDNAAKYMGDQPNPHIKIGARHQAGEVVVFVADNGVGIEPQFQEKVFGLFDQLDASSEGTGIGLALVKRIVEVHGGRIWIESEGAGQGSTFCFTIPPAARQDTDGTSS